MEPPCISFQPENGLNVGLLLIHPEFCNGLFFLRDKEKREVDFLVSKDGEAWFIVEVKTAMNQALSVTTQHPSSFAL